MTSPDVTLGNNVQLEGGTPRLERWLLRQIFKAIGPAPVRIAVEGGAAVSPPGVAPMASVIIRDRWTLLWLAADPEVAFGEAYAANRIDVEGDLAAALQAVYEAFPVGRADRGWYQRLASKWMNWAQDNSPVGSRSNIQSHYDLGNEFYKLWLDARMIYTCAYFPSPTMTLEAAQEAKLDHVCRKLALQPGETVVEAGCGWGALALHMAKHYGVSVKAFNISHEQILYARRRAIEEGLSRQVEFIEDDYRNVRGPFDVFVSVGMLEHVGLKHYADFGDVIQHAVGDRGRGLLHFIGRSYKGDFSRWIRKRIFPGAYAPTLAEAAELLQPHRFAILDVENLRPHYAKTVEHWLVRFENSGQRVCEMYGDWFRRAWRLYLAGSIAGFRSGSLQLFQVTFAGSKSSHAPWTRAALYGGAARAAGNSSWTRATS